MCFFENVEGHISLGLSSVISDLEEMGYNVSWGIFSAAEVGAPHQRKRVFILANTVCNGGGKSGLIRPGANGSQSVSDGKSRGAWPSRPGEPQHGWEPSRVVANTASKRANSRQQFCDEECGQRRALPLELDDSSKVVGNAHSPRLQERQGQRGAAIQGTHANGREKEHWQTEPTVGGDADGTAGGMDYAELCITSDNRTDELRLLGNGVVPATAEKAFRELIKKLN
jgi:site-specific DNA-cytosine methylase